MLEPGLNQFELVKLHAEAATISFKEKFEIMQTMRIYLNNLRLTHISLDLCSPDNTMLFLSSNPTTGYNICSTPLWKLDGSISPTYFKNKDFYWWDDCYVPEAKKAIMERKENAHGISRGFMICKEINGFHFVYSFGLGQNYIDNEHYTHWTSRCEMFAIQAEGILNFVIEKNRGSAYCTARFLD